MVLSTLYDIGGIIYDWEAEQCLEVWLSSTEFAFAVPGHDGGISAKSHLHQFCSGTFLD